MIRVEAAPAPADFDARVRQPGLDAIAELVGEAPSRRRPGPKRKQVANRREEVPAEAFPPLWRNVLQVKPGPRARGEVERRVLETIDQLRLNDAECCAARRAYVDACLGPDPVPFSYVERRAPLVARELRRQRRHLAGDV